MSEHQEQAAKLLAEMRERYTLTGQIIFNGTSFRGVPPISALVSLHALASSGALIPYVTLRPPEGPTWHGTVKRSNQDFPQGVPAGWEYELSWHLVPHARDEEERQIATITSASVLLGLLHGRSEIPTLRPTPQDALKALRASVDDATTIYTDDPESPDLNAALNKISACVGLLQNSLTRDAETLCN